MSKSNWVSYVVFGVLAAAVIASVAIVFAYIAIKQEPTQIHYASRPICPLPVGGKVIPSDQAKVATDKGTEANVSIPTPKPDQRAQDVSDQAADAACYQQQADYDDAENLSAQRRMADSNEQSVYWTRSGFIGMFAVGILDVLIVSAALGAAFWAAREAKRAADAAEMSLIGIERPMLYVEIIEHGGGTYDTPTFRNVRYRFRNFGRTPAVLIGQVAILSVQPWGKIPESIQPTAREVGDGAGRIIPSENATAIFMGAQLNAAPGLKNSDIFSPNKSTFFYGYVWYSDMLGREYARIFHFERHSGEFFPMRNHGQGDPKNYDRRMDT